MEPYGLPPAMISLPALDDVSVTYSAPGGYSRLIDLLAPRLGISEEIKGVPKAFGKTESGGLLSL
jgi:hypothetical protein